MNYFEAGRTMKILARFCAWMIALCTILTIFVATVSADTVGVQPKYKQIYNEVPHLYQTDYAHIRYGKGNMATSGCGITCVAMVASYLTDSYYDPGELGVYYYRKGQSPAARMLRAADDIGIKYQPKTNAFQEVVEALQDGHVVIYLLNGSSDFNTQYGHFIVLTGITEDGRILINDPYEPNYDDRQLKDGFENGFTHEQIKKGFIGAWIFEKKREVPRTIISRKGHLDLLLCCQ